MRTWLFFRSFGGFFFLSLSLLIRAIQPKQDTDMDVHKTILYVVCIGAFAQYELRLSHVKWGGEKSIRWRVSMCVYVVLCGAWHLLTALKSYDGQCNSSHCRNASKSYLCTIILHTVHEMQFRWMAQSIALFVLQLITNLQLQRFKERIWTTHWPVSRFSFVLIITARR